MRPAAQSPEALQEMQLWALSCRLPSKGRPSECNRYKCSILRAPRAANVSPPSPITPNALHTLHKAKLQKDPSYLQHQSSQVCPDSKWKVSNVVNYTPRHAQLGLHKTTLHYMLALHICWRPSTPPVRLQAQASQDLQQCLHYIILYYTIVKYTILHYTTLHYYTILYYAILYYTILYYTVLFLTETKAKPLGLSPPIFQIQGPPGLVKLLLKKR